jgi:hypothetical protein
MPLHPVRFARRQIGPLYAAGRLKARSKEAADCATRGGLEPPSSFADLG